MTSNSIFLKPQADKLPKKRHAWVFSGAIARIEGSPALGSVVAVRDSAGEFIAWGHYNSGSKIRVRLLAWSQDTVLDRDFYYSRLKQAFELRDLWKQDSDALRMVFSEGDGLPGLVADLFGSVLVVQLQTAGMDALRNLLVELFIELIPGLAAIYEKSDGDGRKEEGLKNRTGWLWKKEGTKPSEVFTITEYGLRFAVRPESQKTGFYADQRLNRQRVKAYAKGLRCADIFSFSGAFACHLYAGGAASVTLLDGSAEAISLAKENIELNGMPQSEMVCGDAFKLLREWRREGRKFELIVLDPPKLVTSRAGLANGLKAYKDLNLQTIHLLNPGGILATYSCSGMVSRNDFLQAVNFAVKDSGRTAQVLEHLSQAPDHPVRTTHPEGGYLNGAILRVL